RPRIRPGGTALDIGKNRRRERIAEAPGKRFGILQLEYGGHARKGCDQVGRIDISELCLALDTDHPVRGELVVAADLTTPDETASGVGAIVDKGGRHPSEADLAALKRSQPAPILPPR